MINDNNDIRYVEWHANSAKAVVILVHGLGASVERWIALGEFLRDRGIISYAIELNGDSVGRLSSVGQGSFNKYYADILSLRKKAVNEYPGKKIFIIGESMGGLVAYLLAMRSKDFFDGLICISPAFANKIKFSFGMYVLLGLSFLFSPRRLFKMPFDSTMCTRDEDLIEKIKSDNREHRLSSAGLLADILFGQFRATRTARYLNVPSLFLTAGDDKIVFSAVTSKLFDRVKYNDKKIINYPGMYHSMSIDIGKEKVFNDIYEWIGKRM